MYLSWFIRKLDRSWDQISLDATLDAAHPFRISRQDVPVIQAAISNPVAGMLRCQLISKRRRNGSEPEITDDINVWRASVETDIEEALARMHAAAGAQLAAAVPSLQTVIPARAPSDQPQRMTTSLLTMMSAEGRFIRGVPTGVWTSRHHRWQPQSGLVARGVPVIDPQDAEQLLARRWLERFCPATIDDLQWWTGWNKTTTRRAVELLPI